MAGKTFRCPICKAVIAPVSSRSTESDPASDDPDAPSPSRGVTTAPSSRSAPIPASRPPRDEEPEEDIDPAEEKTIRANRPRKKRSIRKQSSNGLIIGLVSGSVVLLLLLVGGGGALIWHFARSRGKDISQSEWQNFSPPNGDCSALMPGTPQFQPMTTLGITVNKYLVTRVGEKEFFVVAFMNLGPDPIQPNVLEVAANAEREHIMRTLNGTAKSETSIALGNIPGREFQLAIVPHGTLIERIYLAKIGNTHRLYLVVAAGDYLTPNSNDATRFFSSFKIDGAAMPPTFLDAAAPLGGAQPPPAVNPPQPNPRPNPPRPIPGRRIPRTPRRQQ